MCLFALAGGPAFPSEVDVLGCCGAFIILPAVVLLILVACVGDAPWAGLMALAVAGFTYLMASLLVAGFKPSEDTEILEEQASGQRLAGWHGWLTMAAGCSLVVVGARRSVRWLWPGRQKPTRRLTAAERLAVVEDMESRGLVSADEAEGLRHRLKSLGAFPPGAEPPDPARDAGS